MMSNPPSSLHTRQMLHRRQQSTPVVAFEAMKVTNMPAQPQRHNVHRRGQSFDQQRFQQPGMVSMNHTGPIHGQQILREAQQQRISRPGQHQQIQIPPQTQCGYFNSTAPMSAPLQHMPMHDGMSNPNMQLPRSPYYQELNLPLSAGLNAGMGIFPDENNHSYFQTEHMMHGMHLPMEDRRMSQPDLHVQTGLRPYTPTQQIHNAHYPLTPSTTPFKQEYSRSLQSSPVQRGVVHAPYPISMTRSRSLQDIVEGKESNLFDVADMPDPHSFETGAPSKHRQVNSSPLKVDSSPFFQDDNDDVLSLNGQQFPMLSPSKASGSASPGRPALSPRRMSISDLNLEPGISASIEETNVTLDDIAQYIEGPDPRDNKWICKFDGCDKRFGRKENIKSHVQTHLGDRQFRCDHCKKCFVRGHDLKRHAKIHTGTKPYPCLCGNSFARHDALTRHRQRGMCIGAFDGVVKKVIKRGRPRKHRPEMDDRLDKATRTRLGVNDHFEQLEQYASSDSSDSMSSWGSPPTEVMENLSIRGNSPFGSDMALFSMPQQTLNMHNMTMPPDMFSFTPPASPGFSTGNKPSPTYREVTPTDLVSIHGMPHHNVANSIVTDLPNMDNTLLLPQHNMTSSHISQHSLPALSHSSSSPAAEIVAFDFPEDSIGNMIKMHSKMEERNEFDSFLDYGEMDPMSADSFFDNL